MPRKPFPCAVCGEPLQPGPRTLPAGEAAHAKCRGWRARGTSGHGTYVMYKKRGCRCSECKEANRRAGRAYREKRLAEGRPVEKPRARRDCDYCGTAFLARLDTGQRFCSIECARDVQGRRPVSRFKVTKAVRTSIYEACNWTCQLCASPVRPDADFNHPRYPTLDHIRPRALGGSDDPSNLRLACRQCNTLRGTNVDWVPVEAVA